MLVDVEHRATPNVHVIIISKLQREEVVGLDFLCKRLKKKFLHVSNRNRSECKTVENWSSDFPDTRCQTTILGDRRRPMNTYLDARLRFLVRWWWAHVDRRGVKWTRVLDDEHKACFFFPLFLFFVFFSVAFQGKKEVELPCRGELVVRVPVIPFPKGSADDV